MTEPTASPPHTPPMPVTDIPPALTGNDTPPSSPRANGVPADVRTQARSLPVPEDRVAPVGRSGRDRAGIRPSLRLGSILKFAFILFGVLAPLAILGLRLVEEIGRQPPQTLLRGAPSLPGSGPPAPTPIATAAATPHGRPTITGLVITEQAIAGDSGATGVQRGLWVCFVLTPSADNEPLALAITRGTHPPRGTTDSAIVARVDAGPQTAGPFCHAAILDGEVLTPGSYHLWVLHRGEVVGDGPFTIAEPAPSSSPDPEQPAPAPESTTPAATPVARPAAPTPVLRGTARAVSTTAPPAAIVTGPGSSSTPPPATSPPSPPATTPTAAPTASTPVTVVAATPPVQPSPVAAPPTAAPTQAPTIQPTATRPPPRPPATTAPR